MLSVELRRRTWRFDDGSPVRAASAIASLGSGWLVAQDDATHAAWWREDGIAPLRLFPPVAGYDVFAEEDGTKRLKPDLEAACSVDAGGTPSTLLLGSGSLPNRTRAALVSDAPVRPRVTTADLTMLYDLVGRALGVTEERRNLEGACVLGEHLRWFQRGDRRHGVDDASVDVDLAGLLAAIAGDADPATVPFGDVRRYDLGVLREPRRASGAVPLVITDAVALDGGRLLVSAVSEDTDDPVADGPVSGSAVAVLDGEEVVAWARLPGDRKGTVPKVEGLAVCSASAATLELLAVVDADDPATASPVLHLTVSGFRLMPGSVIACPHLWWGRCSCDPATFRAR